tara:strand:- start:916 stop:1320 length:405 start_codon:yes stop_codon:yes gene_type:complete
MTNTPLTIDQLRDLVNKGEAKDPIVFLEAVMNGQDPRGLSTIYELIMEIDDFSGGDISRDNWNEVLDHVMTRFKYQVVSMADSMNATKTLAEYLYPKRKQVEISESNKAIGDPSNHPLTEEEIELFKEKFNDDF